MESNKIATNNKLEKEMMQSYEDELERAIQGVCALLFNGLTEKPTINPRLNVYTCYGINCITCPFNNVESFKDFLEVFRQDREYHNYGK